MNALKVLMVEDDPLFTSQVSYLLQENGIDDFVIKHNSKDAIEIVQNNTFDLILMDINLNDEIDGIDLAQSISKDHNTPIIFISGLTDSSTLKRFHSDYYYCFLKKPLVESDLISKINEIRVFKKIQNECPVNIPSVNEKLNSCMFNSFRNVLTEQETSRAILNATTELTFLINAKGIILDYNKAFARRFPENGKKLRGSNIFDIMPPDLRDERKKRFELGLKQKKPVRFKDQNGDVVFDNHAYPIFDENGDVEKIAIFSKDISEIENQKIENKRLIIELHESEKMSTIGLLSSSIAHEMNNSLTQLFNKLYILQKGMPNDKKHFDLWDQTVQMKQLLLKLSNLSQNVLNYANTKHELNDKVDLHFILVYVISYFKTVKNKDIKFELELADNIPMIDGDTVGIEIVIKNIISNAIKSMNENGTILIQTILSDDQQVHIVIKDNGHGISKEDIQKVFEPFFTTRRKTGGTGLGLLLCKKIVDNHQGSIEIKSQLQQGTEISIKLPIEVDHG